MTEAARGQYQTRMRRVLDHIDRHLDDDLSLDALSAVAAFSKHHFHRQFAATFGLSTHRYVQLARMRRASHHLAFHTAASVTEIALDAGYQTPDAFARAFRQRFSQSPTDFRKAPDWKTWRAAFDPFIDARSQNMANYTLSDVVIRDFPSTAVAVMTHLGDPHGIPDTIRRFVTWRRSVGLGKAMSDTFTIFYCDPQRTPPNQFRLGLCAATTGPIPSNDDRVTSALIPGGRCAVLRVIGSSDDLENPATFLYRDWLPGSGEELRDFPLFCQRVTFYPDAPENETVTDVFLPLV
ncbi:GyrI-like domain-containing protein [Acetobacter sp. DsW_063]|uniref:AraC family transcriptional regulator n=1 Tax=Acetobacter sp. DsW_063 TaxID=1514894 RepID=UPI000B6DAF64|nr:AraC family transcriptional regulator [Acetobacter sp. DsW_063]OUJ14650.1 AraC family transcriptional regulator [Acetobacter sp. DsW_063]